MHISLHRIKQVSCWWITIIETLYACGIIRYHQNKGIMWKVVFWGKTGDFKLWSVTIVLGNEWAGQEEKEGGTALPTWFGSNPGLQWLRVVTQTSVCRAEWDKSVTSACSVPVDRCPPLEVDTLVDNPSQHQWLIAKD